MPADVPQEFQVVKGPQPVGVVEHQRPALREIEQFGHLLLQPGQIGVDLLHAQQLAHLVLVGGIANHAGPPTYDGDGPVAMPLNVGQGHDRHQMAHVKAVGAGIKADVAGDGLFDHGADALCIGRLFDKASFG